MSRKLRRMATSTGALGVLMAMLIGPAAGLAAATTVVSQATAQAASLDLGTGSVLTTNMCDATNDGTVASPGTISGSCTTTGALSLLGTQSFITAGVLAQEAAARPDGTSAACAGATGAGGSIQVGSTAPCVVNPGTPPHGVSIGSSGVLGVGGITADAIYAFCTASPTAVPTGGATLVDANLGTGVLVGGLTTLPVNPTVNDTLSVTLLGVNLGTVVLNEQTPTTPVAGGPIAVTALDLNILGAHLKVGSVTCGPNTAVVPPTPMFPVKGLPIAGGMLAVAGGATWLARRRLFAAFRD